MSRQQPCPSGHRYPPTGLEFVAFPAPLPLVRHRHQEDSPIDWPYLFQIIEGVAQGLHCLHEQGIAHLDIKPSNILLDSDMNPKIIDFGISEVLNGNEIRHGDALRGTVEYLSLEYMADGIVSTKNDVYAFGVTLLQIISSMCTQKPRHCSFYQWVWDAWEAGQIEESDPSLFDRPQLMEINRSMQIGLLCSQDHPANRPTMADVLEMLNGKKELPVPKKPAWVGAPSA